MFLVLVVFAILGFQSGESASCDPKIIKAIHKLWEKSGVPKGILDDLIQHRTAIVVGTNKGYIEVEKDVQCLKQRYFKDYQTHYRYYNNGSEALVGNTILVECHGTVYTPYVAMRRYFLPMPKCSGVVALYRCYDDEEAGVAEGQVMVYGDGHEKEAVNLAIKMLAQVGVKIEKRYPETCP